MGGGAWWAAVHGIAKSRTRLSDFFHFSLSTFMHWRRNWQPTLVLLPGKFHGRRSLVGYSPWSHKELDMTERLHFLSFFMVLLNAALALNAGELAAVGSRLAVTHCARYVLRDKSRDARRCDAHARGSSSSSLYPGGQRGHTCCSVTRASRGCSASPQRL